MLGKMTSSESVKIHLHQCICCRLPFSVIGSAMSWKHLGPRFDSHMGLEFFHKINMLYNSHPHTDFESLKRAMAFLPPSQQLSKHRRHLSSSLRFNGHFPGEPGLTSVY